MIEKQKLDWELVKKYADSLPNKEHTRLISTEELTRDNRYYTFRFGEAERDSDRPMGFPIASCRRADGALLVSQTRYNHHTLTTSSTGSGKTQGVVLNCAFNADNRMSYLFADPKGEILKASYARLCELFGKNNVLIANFLDPGRSMVHFNPFTDLAYEWLDSEHKKDKKALRDNIISKLKKIFEVLYPIESDRDKSWERTAQSFLLGIVLGLFEDLTLTPEQSKETGRHRTTPEMINFESLIKVYNSFKWGERVFSFEDGGFLSTREKTSLARTYTYSVISNAASTRANYLGFVDLYLSRYSDPKILEISRYNNIRASALSDSPKVLFIVYDISHEATRDYVNICIGKLISDLLEISHRQSFPLHTPVNFILEEFATLRASPIYPNLLATGRGSNIFMHMIVQNLEQIHARYPDEWESMIDNCDVQFFLGSNSLKTAKHFAESLGDSVVPDSEAFLRGEFRIKQETVVSLDHLLHGMTRGETFVRINNAQPLHTGFELYYHTPEYTAYSPANPKEIIPPLPLAQIDRSQCQYRLPEKQESDDNLDCLFNEDNIDETEKDFMNDAENCEKEDVKNDKDEIHECLSKLLDWMYLPFSYNRSDPEETDNFAMDRITDLMRLNKEYDRHKIIQILQTVKKSNIIEENNEMLDILIHQFSIATDKEYETLQRLIFKEDAE